ncbi:MAG: Ig-like domain-containing protein [Firmicutes bacterium]|nr:Ig-like domain-containing protein [Bacillota bacterium]
MKRRLMVIILSLTLIFTLIPMTAFAVEDNFDVNEPVDISSGHHLIIRNMIIENQTHAIKCSANNLHEDGPDVSVKVNGNVEINAGTKGQIDGAIQAESDVGKATVDINGYLKAEANETAVGISSDAGSIVKVGSNVSVKSNENLALGVELQGEHDKADIDGGVQIGGNISVTGKEGSAGIVLGPNGGEGATVNVSGNVTAISNTDFTYGAVVHLADNSGQADIIVEGEIKAKDTAVILQKEPGDASQKCSTNLTVWKANINSRGNVAEIGEPGNLDDRNAAEDFEKNNINYIVKFKQPSEGGALYAVNSSGNSLKKSHGFRVAREGDKIIVKANLDSGWKLKSVYDNGKALKKDANGNFYLTVHKGGGILLSADLLAPGEDPTEMGSDGTAVGEGASAAAADQKITGMKTDTDPKGSKFNKLRLRSTYQTKTSITLKWKSNSKAAKYVIYGNRCGSSTKIRKSVKLYTVKKSTKTTMTKVIKKVKGAKLKKNTYYKFLIVALNKNNKVVSTSRMIHVATKGGKYTNYKKISVDKEKITKAKNLKKGKSLKLEAKQIKVTKSLKARKHVAIRYESSNKKIATVTTKGVIKAKAKGTCYVYIYAQNGVYKRIKVVVK